MQGHEEKELSQKKDCIDISTKGLKKFSPILTLEFQQVAGAMRIRTGRFPIVTGSLFRTKEASRTPYISTPRINARLREEQDAKLVI